MNEKFTKLEILDSSSPNSSTPGGGNKWFNVIIIVFIVLVAGVYAMFQLGALSVSDLVKKDENDYMVFNSTSTTESTSDTSTTTTRGINGTTIGTTTSSRITTTTESTQAVDSETRALFNKLKDDGWDCVESTLVCASTEEKMNDIYLIYFDLINLNFKLKNSDTTTSSYEYIYDFRTKAVTGTYNGTHLNYNSDQSFLVYDDQGNQIKGEGATLASRTETYARYYINKGGALLARLVE